MNKIKTSRIPGFYNLEIDERINELKKGGHLSTIDAEALSGIRGLSLDLADNMVENVVGIFSLPLGIALNFLINGRDVLIPMVIEEPSVIAGASYMAKLARLGGGFEAHCPNPEMIAQIQLLDVPDPENARTSILGAKEYLLEMVNHIDPIIAQLGGGGRDLEVRIITDSPIGTFLVIHLIIDVRDAMGANLVNSAAELIAPYLATLSGGRPHLKILSNLADRRLASARCTIPLQELAHKPFTAEEVRDGIIAAWAFAEADPYRAATHNKGIMNGIDAVVIATGNDWRAVEAGAHAYAARSGRYSSLSTWGKDELGNLVGTLEMPMAVGIVGGATQVHPAAKAALNLMGVENAGQLAEAIISVGLAQNLAALRALATEGIQRGHMELHARQIAISAGAQGDLVQKLASQMVKEGIIRIDRARQILTKWKSEE
jgi:hydroxymethylglutaryl-CoA reductase